MSNLNLILSPVEQQDPIKTVSNFLERDLLLLETLFNLLGGHPDTFTKNESLKRDTGEGIDKRKNYHPWNAIDEGSYDELSPDDCLNEQLMLGNDDILCSSILVKVENIETTNHGQK